MLTSSRVMWQDMVMIQVKTNNLGRNYISSFKGTKTWKRVDSAEKKKSAFYNILGKLQFQENYFSSVYF